MNYRAKASRPDPEVEKAATGSSEVKTWVMSPEELEDYRARTGYKAPTDSVGKDVSQPVLDKSVRPEPVQEPSKEGRKSAIEPDKQVFLEAIATGKSIPAAERDFGMKRNALYYWVKKWGLAGITPEGARKLLETPKPPTSVSAQLLLRSTSTVAKAIEAKVAEASGLIAQRENGGLQAKLAALVERNERLDLILVSYESDLARWAQSDTENQQRISELQEERDSWKIVAVQRKEEAYKLGVEITEALQAIEELQEERQILLETIEVAAMPPTKTDPNNTFQALVSLGVLDPVPDNVNHPAHYTAGGIECIDAIDAATTGLTGGQAYSTGAAIKYLWRWSRKNGVEDLEKAAWYVNRLISSIDQEIRDTV